MQVSYYFDGTSDLDLPKLLGSITGNSNPKSPFSTPPKTDREAVRISSGKSAVSLFAAMIARTALSS